MIIARKRKAEDLTVSSISDSATPVIPRPIIDATSSFIYDILSLTNVSIGDLTNSSFSESLLVSTARAIDSTLSVLIDVAQAIKAIAEDITSSSIQETQSVVLKPAERAADYTLSLNIDMAVWEQVMSKDLSSSSFSESSLLSLLYPYRDETRSVIADNITAVVVSTYDMTQSTAIDLATILETTIDSTISQAIENVNVIINRIEDSTSSIIADMGYLAVSKLTIDLTTSYITDSKMADSTISSICDNYQGIYVPVELHTVMETPVICYNILEPYDPVSLHEVTQ